MLNFPWQAEELVALVLAVVAGGILVRVFILLCVAPGKHNPRRLSHPWRAAQINLLKTVQY